MTTREQRTRVPAGDSRPGADRGDRFIPLAIDLLGVVLVAGLAFYFGTTLFEGVTTRAVALVGIGAITVMMIIAPDVGLLSWIAIAPFGSLFNVSMGRGLPDLSLSRIAAAVMLCLLLAQVAAGTRRLVRPGAVEAWGAVFLVAMSLSISASRLGWTGGAQNVFDLVALPLLCYFFASNVLRKPRHLSWFAVTVALVGAVLGVIAVREQLTNQAVLSPTPYRWEYGQHSVKVTSLFGAPATMALSLALTLPFTLVGALRSRTLVTRLAWFAAVAAISAGLLLTYVRAGWLAGVLEVLIVAFLARGRAGSAGKAFLLLLLLVALLAALMVGAGLVDPRALQERIQSERPIEYRMGAISVALEIARQAPLLGLGFDNFSDAGLAAGWRPLGSSGLPSLAPHNLFLYVLTSAGLLALIPLLGLFATIGLRLLHLLRNTGATAGSSEHRDWVVAAFAMFIGYLLMANTFDALGASYASVLLFVAMGAALTDIQHTRGSGPDEGTNQAAHFQPGVAG